MLLFQQVLSQPSTPQAFLLCLRVLLTLLFHSRVYQTVNHPFGPFLFPWLTRILQGSRYVQLFCY
jgi:hypothetical protein